MMDALRRILYPAFVATIIATLWAMGHAQAMSSQAYNRRYLPPANPQLFRFDEKLDAVESEPKASPAVYVDDF